MIEMNERSAPSILVVDDDARLRQVYRDWLSAAGFRVTIAKGAKEALALALEAPPDVVVLDVSEPAVDGMEVAERLRRSPATSRVPIIAVTAFPLREVAMRAYRTGFTSLLAKPFHAVELLQLLSRVLGGETGRDIHPR
jgi:CheY-like chemotaxis protein